MGLYDDVKCDYPLPWPEMQGKIFQSYDTEAQYLEYYELRANGELWYRKVTRKVVEDAGRPLGYYYENVGEEWVRENVTGEVALNLWDEPNKTNYVAQFWMRDGVVRDAVFRKSVEKPQQER